VTQFEGEEASPKAAVDLAYEWEGKMPRVHPEVLETNIGFRILLGQKSGTCFSFSSAEDGHANCLEAISSAIEELTGQIIGDASDF
jgi:hypothetical protein